MLLGTSRWASTRCFLTWKAKDTPQSRLIFQLAQSTLRTSDAECGFWHTPNVPNGGRVNPPDMSPTGILANGKKRQVGLEHQVRQVEKGFWPTHKAEAFFPTPRASDGDKGGPNQKIGGKPALASIAAMFPTPTAQDAKNSTLPPSQRERDSLPGHLIRDGVSGQLNPEWVEWLMGFPAGWTELKDSETP